MDKLYRCMQNAIPFNRPLSDTVTVYTHHVISLFTKSNLVEVDAKLFKSDPNTRSLIPAYQSCDLGTSSIGLLTKSLQFNTNWDPCLSHEG